MEATSHERLIAATSHLDADDLAYLADALPEDVLRTASRQLDAGERSWLDQSRAHGKDTVAGLMSPEVVFIRDDQTVDDALVHLRQRGELPPQTDRLFVVDARNVLKGSVPLQALLLTDPRQPAAAITNTDEVVLRPDEDGRGSGAGVRALQPRLGAGRRRSQQADRPAHRRSGDGLQPPARRAPRPRARRPARRGGPVRLDLGQRPQPLAVAVREPGHRLHRVTRHRRVRGHHPAARRARRADADRRQHRRQHRQPDRRRRDPRPGPRTRSQGRTPAT